MTRRAPPLASAAALGALAALVTVTLAAPRAADAAEPRKSVAVLEYRAGVEGAAGLAARLASRLAQTAALTVIDPAEARRRLPRVDSEVARCAGDPMCVARLGARLSVDEVLLVAVSQLGDVVLALQRIDVVAAETGPHLAETLPPGQDPDDEKLIGWLRQLYPPEVFKRFGSIAVSANVDGAELQLNGQKRGLTPLAGPLRVPAPRAYRLNVAKPGYVPFSARIDVLPDATVEVRAELSPREGTAWYKRWYLWAIVGGAVAGGAIGVAAYATRPDDSKVAGAIRW